MIEHHDPLSLDGSLADTCGPADEPTEAPPPSRWLLTDHGKANWPLEIPLVLPEWGLRFLLDTSRLDDQALTRILLDLVRRNGTHTYEIEGPRPHTFLRNMPVGSNLRRVG